MTTMLLGDALVMPQALVLKHQQHTCMHILLAAAVAMYFRTAIYTDCWFSPGAGSAHGSVLPEAELVIYGSAL